MILEILPPIPQALNNQAEQRYEQWFLAFKQYSKKIDSDSIQKSEVALLDELNYKLNERQKEQISRLLVASDYFYQWALKKPHWVVNILSCSASNLEQDMLKDLELNDYLKLSEYEIKQWLRMKRHYWLMNIIFLDVFQLATIGKITHWQSLLALELIAHTEAFVNYNMILQYGKPTVNSGQQSRLLILAMGKLGGNELNFSSDIDLIFCYSDETVIIEEGGNNKQLECNKFFTRVGQKIIALLSENTADGFVYRVDMRLRPYGQSGALVSSFGSLQDYYVEQGREWERFAMIKASVVENKLSENLEQKNKLLKIIRPFSFRRYIDFSVLDSIRQLKQKIRSEISSQNLTNDIKLGDGGIRELEFIVQSLQLISGGRVPQLQVTNWRNSIELLVEHDILEQDKATQLIEAYKFLRKVENALQIRSDKQTQKLPSLEQEQVLVALLAGYSDWESMNLELKTKRKRVSDFFAKLFQDPDEVHEDNDLYQTLKSIYLGLSTIKDNQRKINTANIKQVYIDKIVQFKKNYVNNKLGPRGQKRLASLLPNVLMEATRQKNAEETLERVISILQGIGRRSAYFELLLENLPLLQHLCDLCSRSGWLAEQLALYPSLLDELLFPSNFGKAMNREDFANQLRQALIRIEVDQVEEQLFALARFKQACQFKIAAGDLNRRFGLLSVSQQLSDLSAVIIDYTLQMAWSELVSKHGVPVGAHKNQISGYLIIGYGKLGGIEMGYGSDLDLVFLYQAEANSLTDGPKPIDSQQFYTRLSQRIVHYLSTRTQQGIMYEVDTRLRPSGRSGMLVSHIDSFKNYQREQAWTWEHQALVRARVIAGDNKLGRTYQAIRKEILTHKRDADELASQVVLMRKKMRDNLDSSNAKQWSIKQGFGGIVDIEFLVQYWVLKLVPEMVKEATNDNELDAKLLPYRNLDWLNLLYEAGYIKKEQWHRLFDTYKYYQQLTNQRVLQKKSVILDREDINSDSQLFLRQKQVVSIWDSTFDPSVVQ